MNFLKAAFLSAFTLFATSAFASQWTVDTINSKVSFTFVQNGASSTGSFNMWNAAIVFDPAAPENAKIEATIQTGSADTGNAQTDITLAEQAWFDINTYPDAVFTSSEVKALGGDKYEANGNLAMRGVSVPVVLPFTLKIDGDTATAKGKITLDRTNFGIGNGTPESTVENGVIVEVDVIATR